MNTMKKYVFSCAAAVALLSACGETDELSGVLSSGNRLDGVQFSVKPFENEGASRVGITPTAEGVEFTWTAGDTLGVFPQNGYPTAFPISDGANTSTACFDGADWALRPNAQYVAYYPFAYSNNDKSDIRVSYVGQAQSGNNSAAHLGAYDYLASAYTDVDADGNALFQLSHLGALVKISLVMPEADSYSKLTVSTDAGNFTTVARYGLSHAAPSLSAVTTATSVEMDLSGISTAAATQSITLYMMLAPTNLSGATLTFSITGSKSYTGTASGKNMTAGAAYAYSVTCEAPAPVGGSHEYVDLGLPSGTLWATCNVGANSPEEYGDYFAWGETEPYYTEGHSQDDPCENWKAGKSGYNWANYKWCNGSNDTMTKYCTSSNYGTVDNKTVLESADDAATANWGGSWRMPTEDELKELINNCTWTWTTLNGVNGYKVVGPNGNFIFLPAAGYRNDSWLNDAGLYGKYWSSSLYTDGSIEAYNLHFYSGYRYWFILYYRFYGFSVRPVCQ